MNPLTLEWVQKAEGDWATAQRELRARKNPNFDAAGFHAQQCVEKYLKARIQEAGQTIHKTHDLIKILEVLQPVPLSLSVMGAGLIHLSRFAVEFRYPGSVTATRAEAKAFLIVAKTVRVYVRDELGFPPDAPRKRAVRKNTTRRPGTAPRQPRQR